MGTYVARKALLLITGLLIVVVTVRAQTLPKPKPQAAAPTPSNPTAAASKGAPTLAFNNAKDIPPIIDTDAFVEEGKLKEKLPGNEFVETKRALHEGILQTQFLDG